MDAAQIPAPQLGRILVAAGLLNEEQLAQALEEQEQTGRRLGEIIVRRGFISGPALANALAEQHGGVLKTEYGFASGLGGVVARRAASEAGMPISPLRAPDATAIPQLRTAAPPAAESKQESAAPPPPNEVVPMQDQPESPQPQPEQRPAPPPLLRTAEPPEPAVEMPPEPEPPAFATWRPVPEEREEETPPASTHEPEPTVDEPEVVSSLEPEPTSVTEATEPALEPFELRQPSPGPELEGPTVPVPHSAPVELRPPSPEPVYEPPASREAQLEPEPAPPAEAAEHLPEPVELRPPAPEPELEAPPALEFRPEPMPPAKAPEPLPEPLELRPQVPEPARQPPKPEPELDPVAAGPDEREALIESLHARLEAQEIELANLREQLEQERARKEVQVHVLPEEQPPAAPTGPAQKENYLLCVPTPAGYVLLDRVGALPTVGQAVDVPEEEGHFTVTKVVRLPRNGRPCAYLQRA